MLTQELAWCTCMIIFEQNLTILIIVQEARFQYCCTFFRFEALPVQLKQPSICLRRPSRWLKTKVTGVVQFQNWIYKIGWFLIAMLSFIQRKIYLSKAWQTNDCLCWRQDLNNQSHAHTFHRHLQHCIQVFTGKITSLNAQTFVHVPHPFPIIAVIC